MAQELNTETIEEPSSDPIAAVAGQFGLDGQIFVAQLVNFLIVLLVLWWFAYKPIVRLLEERQEKIEKSVKQAEEIEKRMDAIEQEHDSIVIEARKEAQTIIGKAQTQGKERGEEIVSAAKREVERVIAKGKQQLEEEKAGMLRDLRKDVVEISITAAEKILREKIDDSKSQSLAEEVVRKMS